MILLATVLDGYFFKKILIRFGAVPCYPNEKYGSGYIKLPDKLKKSKRRNNIKNTNDKCFLWCHADYLALKQSKTKIKNPERVSKLYRKIAKKNSTIAE